MAYERDAERAGYSFTGMCWSKWDTEAEARHVARAKELKATYSGVDYRIVTGSKSSWLGTSSKGIWGNELFQKVMYYDVEKQRKYLDSYEKRVAQAKAKYEEELENLAKKQASVQAEYDEIMALRKRK